MKIAIRKGHMLGVDQGANGLVNEYEINRAYTPYVIAALQRAGVEVIDVTPEEGSADNMYDSIHIGIDKANEAGADLFVSCHVNSFSRSDVYGTTGYSFPGSAQGKLLIMSIISEISNLGFSDRGYMEGKDYWELKDTNMTAVIVEPFFCVSPVDVDIYNRVGPKGLGEAIAKGILNYCGIDFVPGSETVIDAEYVNTANTCGTVKFTQIYGGNLEAIFEDSNGEEYIGLVKLDNIVKKG